MSRLGFGIAAGGVAVSALVLSGCRSEASPPTPSPEPAATPITLSRFTEATVVDVVDGTSIDVDIDGQAVRVRYLGIEVPEAGDGASLGERALEFNRFLVEGRTVELERGSVDTDRLGRLLRYVYVDGEMVNMALLTNGLATVAGSPESFEHSTAFAVAEEHAKRAGRGYWKSESGAIEGEEESGPTPVMEPFTGGTLPLPPDLQESERVCDFSDTSVPMIKGNVEPGTGKKVYHVPGGFFYKTTVVDGDDGDKWFCTEEQAITAGWTKSKH